MLDLETVTAFFRRAETDAWTKYGATHRLVAKRLWVGIETSYGAPEADRWVEFDDFRIVAGCLMPRSAKLSTT